MIIDFKQSQKEMKNKELESHKTDINWLINEFIKTANEYEEHQKKVDSLMEQLEQSTTELDQTMRDLIQVL